MFGLLGIYNSIAEKTGTCDPILGILGNFHGIVNQRSLHIG
jgi:hypothetical protein